MSEEPELQNSTNAPLVGWLAVIALMIHVGLMFGIGLFPQEAFSAVAFVSEVLGVLAVLVAMLSGLVALWERTQGRLEGTNLFVALLPSLIATAYCSYWVFVLFSFRSRSLF